MSTIVPQNQNAAIVQQLWPGGDIPLQWPEHSDPEDSVMTLGCNTQPQRICGSLVKQWVFFKDIDCVDRNFGAAYKQ